MGSGLTWIALLCIGAIVLIALVMMFSSGDATRTMDDVYARRKATEPSGDASATDAYEPGTVDEKGHRAAGTSAGRSRATEGRRRAA